IVHVFPSQWTTPGGFPGQSGGPAAQMSVALDPQALVSGGPPFQALDQAWPSQCAMTDLSPCSKTGWLPKAQMSPGPLPHTAVKLTMVSNALARHAPPTKWSRVPPSPTAQASFRLTLHTLRRSLAIPVGRVDQLAPSQYRAVPWAPTKKRSAGP